jgi:outer membrane receptor protein involved in Fe transport
VDTYSSSNQILLYNLNGKSYSRSFQIAFNYEIFKRFDLRLAYKNDQVVMDFKTGSSQKPLVPKHRALVNVSYSSRKDEWRYDLTTQYQGMTKLAVSDENTNLPGNGDSQIKNNRSPEFITINCQITRIFNKQWEVYAGVENLTDFRQENTVINANDPFGEGFDATNIWGPVMGRKIYAGFRFKIPNKTK